jgi:hypothetical protein
MGTVITFPAERCSVGTRLAKGHGDGASVIILPVVRVQRYDETPSDGVEPSSTSRRGKRRKR